MKRDMELIRKILFAIEEKYVDTWLDSSEIVIEGYDLKTIAYHCAILYDGGFVNDYKGEYGDNGLSYFGVGALTWEGQDFLEKIRSDTIWNKTKDVMTKKGIPFLVDTIKEIATSIATSMAQAAIS